MLCMVWMHVLVEEGRIECGVTESMVDDWRLDMSAMRYCSIGELNVITPQLTDGLFLR